MCVLLILSIKKRVNYVEMRMFWINMFCVFSLMWMSSSEYKSFILFVLHCSSQIVSLPREKSVILPFIYQKFIVFCCVPSIKIGTRDTKVRGQGSYLQEVYSQAWRGRLHVITAMQQVVLKGRSNPFYLVMVVWKGRKGWWRVDLTSLEWWIGTAKQAGNWGRAF